MTPDNNRLQFNIAPGQRLVLLLLMYLLGMIVTAFIATFLFKIGGDGRHVAMLRISTMLQDVLMLVLPAVATAVLVTRRPARLLAVDTVPGVKMIVPALLAVVVSAPVMTLIIKLNASVTFPPALSALEQTLRRMEANAGESIAAMMGEHTPLNLMMNLLIVAVMAGFSEELFFRGALQRLLQSSRIGRHAAVWIAAIVFSAIHMQFFGFVPRMLLGAYFGYLLLWSGSVWLPMAAHVLNNAMFIVLSYFTGNGDPEIAAGGAAQWAVPAASVVLTALCLAVLHRNRVAAPAAAGRQ